MTARCAVCDRGRWENGRGLLHSTGWSHLGWRASDTCQLRDAGEGLVWFIVSRCRTSLYSCTKIESVEQLLPDFLCECMLCRICSPFTGRSSTSVIMLSIIHQNYICTAKEYWSRFAAAHKSHTSHLLLFLLGPLSIQGMLRKWELTFSVGWLSKTIFYLDSFLHIEHAPQCDGEFDGNFKKSIGCHSLIDTQH